MSIDSIDIFLSQPERKFSFPALLNSHSRLSLLQINRGGTFSHEDILQTLRLSLSGHAKEDIDNEIETYGAIFSEGVIFPVFGAQFTKPSYSLKRGIAGSETQFIENVLNVLYAHSSSEVNIPPAIVDLENQAKAYFGRDIDHASSLLSKQNSGIYFEDCNGDRFDQGQSCAIPLKSELEGAYCSPVPPHSTEDNTADCSTTTSSSSSSSQFPTDTKTTRGGGGVGGETGIFETNNGYPDNQSITNNSYTTNTTTNSNSNNNNNNNNALIIPNSQLMADPENQPDPITQFLSQIRRYGMVILIPQHLHDKVSYNNHHLILLYPSYVDIYIYIYV